MDVILITILSASGVAAAACAFGLRALRAPAWSVLGGVVVGVAVGPTLLGRLAPDWYEQHIIGGRADRESLVAAQREHGSKNAARLAAGLVGEQVREAQRAEQEREAELERALKDARRAHSRPWALSIAFLATTFFVAAGVARRETVGPVPDWYASLSTGLWSAVFPGSITLLILLWLDVDWQAAVATAAAVGAGSVLVRTGDLLTSAEAETGGARLIQQAARIAGVVAIVALGWMLQRATAPIWLFAPLAAVFAGWVLPPARRNGLLLGLIDFILVPALTAFVVMRIELYEHLLIWPLLLIVLVSGDGRWLGAYIGAMLANARKSLRTMRLVLAAMSAGTAQVGFTAIALAAEIIPESLAYALIAGALVMEMTTRARRRMATEIARVEEEVDEMMGDI